MRVEIPARALAQAPQNLLSLEGCKPTPLAHYLKALGILRVVAEQADPTVRGAWRGGSFVLLTQLTRQGLIDFFLHDYEPAPILSPWNGGSGFYPKDNQSGISAIATGEAPRFAPYRKAIERARVLVGEREKRPDAGVAKNEMMALCLAEWGERALGWLFASVLIGDEGDPAYPSLLGTGGNDGRLDFSNNYMQRLVELFDPKSGHPSLEAVSLLPNALFAEPSSELSGGAIGQFYPGGASGANSGPGFDGKPRWNIWDFVLMLEGSLLLRVAGLRKLDSSQSVQASAPFALRAQARGFATASDGEDAPRGEQWFPLWSAPASRVEVEQLFAEARLRSSSGEPAKAPLDAAKALSSLGVSRGIDAFVRYQYLERNGQANLAIPTGVFAVRHQPKVRYLDEVDGFLRQIRRVGSGNSAFARLSRTLDNAALACAENPNDSRRWQLLVMALGDAEQAFNSRPKLVVDAFLRPLPLLDPQWFNSMDDGSAELRLALAIATAGSQSLGPIRRHALPLSAKSRYRELEKSSEGLVNDPEVVWRHRELASDLAAIATRRATGSEGGLFPLSSPFPANLDDVNAFLDGNLDELRILRLSRGLMTLNTARLKDVEIRYWRPSRGQPLAAHALLRLAYPNAKGDFPQKHASNHILRLLSAGQLELAANALERFLVAQGLRPKLHRLAGSPAFARRLAASVAIPLSASTHRQLFHFVSRSELEPNQVLQPNQEGELP